MLDEEKDKIYCCRSGTISGDRRRIGIFWNQILYHPVIGWRIIFQVRKLPRIN